MNAVLSALAIEPLQGDRRTKRRQEKGKKYIELEIKQFSENLDTYLSEVSLEKVRPGQKIGPLSYKQIQQYFDNSQAHVRKFNMVIKKVLFVQRAADKKSFSSSQSMFLWHGTLEGNIPRILKEGFKITSATSQRLVGDGLYFADRASKSGLYCKVNGQQPKYGFLFLCQVFLGKRYPAKGPDYNRTSAPEGYDSIQCIGVYKPDPRGEIMANGISIPAGKTVKNQSQAPLPLNGRDLTFNEYVVYSPEQVCIRYLVHFDFEYP